MKFSKIASIALISSLGANAENLHASYYEAEENDGKILAADLQLASYYYNSYYS